MATLKTCILCTLERRKSGHRLLQELQKLGRTITVISVSPLSVPSSKICPSSKERPGPEERSPPSSCGDPESEAATGGCFAPDTSAAGVPGAGGDAGLPSAALTAASGFPARLKAGSAAAESGARPWLGLGNVREGVVDEDFSLPFAVILLSGRPPRNCWNVFSRSAVLAARADIHD